MKTSSRSNVDPFIVMDVLEAATQAERQGRSIIHMEVGQPNCGAPQQALDLLSSEMQRQSMGYTVALGLPQLREGISQLYKRWYGLDVDASRIIITSGSSSAFILAFTALFDAGDKVGLGEPGYPSYRQILSGLSICDVGIQTEAENRFQPVAHQIDAALDGMIVASPANPSGTMLGIEELRNLIEHCHKHDISFISDEIYHGIQYEKRPVSALEISDDVYVINSFSKFFSMTGWRIGWMIVPEDHVRTIERLAQNFFICPPHAAQIAAIGALEAYEHCADRISEYARNRNYLLQELPKIGFDKIAPPDGAFYIYADVSKFTDNSLHFCEEILQEVGVAITPGLDFDPSRGASTVRFSYSRTYEEIVEAVSRLKKYMTRYDCAQ